MCGWVGGNVCREQNRGREVDRREEEGMTQGRALSKARGAGEDPSTQVDPDLSPTLPGAEV